jgi:hypothetical protein
MRLQVDFRMPSSIPANQAASKNKKTNSLLLEQQAIKIFKLKMVNDSRCPGDKLSAAAVARMYGVSDKTIRDIWRGRTWSRETQHMDQVRKFVFKQVGRPRGSKDKKPRKVRSGDDLRSQEHMTVECVGSESDPMGTGEVGLLHSFVRYNKDTNGESEAPSAHHQALEKITRDSSYLCPASVLEPCSQMSGLRSIDDDLFEWAQTSPWCFWLLGKDLMD